MNAEKPKHRAMKKSEISAPIGPHMFMKMRSLLSQSPERISITRLWSAAAVLKYEINATIIHMENTKSSIPKMKLNKSF